MTVPQQTEAAVLVVDGSSDSGKKDALHWMESIERKLFPRLKKLIVLMLGDENCNNDWIRTYMSSHNGPVHALLLVYDSPLIDDKEYFQWPLGVAT